MAERENIGIAALTNMIWKLAERIGAQLISLIVQIVLARLLLPKEFGVIAIVEVFITLLNVFITSGLGVSLIQKKDADEVDFSSALVFNLIFSIFLYLCLFISAPYIQKFYNFHNLSQLIRVLGLSIFLCSIKTIQQAKIQKNLQFKLFFKATLGGTILSGIIGVLMAYSGYGVWALVAQYLSNSVVDITILFLTMNWKPKFVLSWTRLKPLIDYGWKILLASFIDTFYNELRSFIIGKKYSPQDLAFFSRGKQIPTLLTTNLSVTIESVMFPVLSIFQNNKDDMRGLLRRFIRTSSYILTPSLIFLAIISKPLVRLLLTEKWLFCVPYLIIFAFDSALRPLHISNNQMIKALGRSDLTLKIEIIKKTFGVILLFSVMNFGVLWIAISMLFYSIVVLLINSYPAKKLINYSFKEQLFDYLPSFLLALLVGAIIYPITLIKINDIFIIVISLLIGFLLYGLFSKLLKMDSYDYVITIVKKLKNRRKGIQ